MHCPRERNELLPWSVIDNGVAYDYLWNDYQRAELGHLTAPCHTTCNPLWGVPLNRGEQTMKKSLGPQTVSPTQRRFIWWAVMIKKVVPI